MGHKLTKWKVGTNYVVEKKFRPANRNLGREFGLYASTERKNLANDGKVFNFKENKDLGAPFVQKWLKES
ncbi:hypothetical protein A8F94_12280 [Bacillus sp. FJAT-27225]|uniref:hypothetical protein n=1 Tax=Bacillus sp. FJAT-27225 TaxID=1743144 RepID=UPI00080C2B53|nr:hypothetical protein [Bacillus sp. FJAT-27225]OCA85648.1 hypothetical protein A8F94_12280 [Bacillus sp. FJAT-27225]